MTSSQPRSLAWSSSLPPPHSPSSTVSQRSPRACITEDPPRLIGYVSVALTAAIFVVIPCIILCTPLPPDARTAADALARRLWHNFSDADTVGLLGAHSFHLTSSSITFDRNAALASHDLRAGWLPTQNYVAPRGCPPRRTFPPLLVRSSTVLSSRRARLTCILNVAGPA
ncbi:hypothetical protein FB451DRAFT_1533446 [Mycena latifolia]|nr:hypothetical protein FB451DRAFT_1533446 [Mycena latifolia]